MSTRYCVTIDIEVFDPDALYAAACDRLKADGCANADDALHDGDGAVDIGACLIAVLDPGVSPPGTDIQLSSATTIDTEGIR